MFRDKFQTGSESPIPNLFVIPIVIPSALFLARGICFSRGRNPQSRFLAPLGMTSRYYFAREMNSAAGGFTP